MLFSVDKHRTLMPRFNYKYSRYISGEHSLRRSWILGVLRALFSRFIQIGFKLNLCSSVSSCMPVFSAAVLKRKKGPFPHTDCARKCCDHHNFLGLFFCISPPVPIVPPPLSIPDPPSSLVSVNFWPRFLPIFWDIFLK